MYKDLIDKLNLEELENEDREYINIMNLVDNKHLQEELIKDEEEKEDEDDFKLESLTDIIREEEKDGQVK